MGGKKKIAAGLLLVLLIGAGACWIERVPLLSWYYLRGLSRASEAERGWWIERVAGLGEPAIEGLLDSLADEDDRACRNAAAALDHLACTWGSSDARVVDLAGREARLFDRMSPAGQAGVLHGMAGWFRNTAPAEGLVPACARLLGDAAASSDAGTQLAGLELAEALVRQSREAEILQPARDMARTGLRSLVVGNRLYAVRLGLQPGMELLESVVGLLRDPAAEVRQAAILAVGPANQAVPDEELLSSLHDSDAEVRRLAEAALRGRGLQPKHIELGRLLTHPDHRTRLQVLDHLRDAADLDPGLWLRRLSHDSRDSVRAAAVRVMSRLSHIDLSDRIDQMARSDPSPSVAQLAQYYLSCKREVNPPLER